MFQLNRYDTIKLIAIILMLIDHIGALFFPQTILLRIIGRLCMPIFAFCIAEGYKNSKDKKNKVVFFKNSYSAYEIYLYKLFIFGCISQIPYTLVFDTKQLNIMFSFVFSLLLLKLIDKKIYIHIPLILLSIVILNNIFSIEAIWIVLTMVITFYYRTEWFKNNILDICFLQFVVIIYSIYKGIPSYQIYNIISSMSLLLLFKYVKIKKIPRKLPKFFFYWFYPLHILILGVFYYL